MKSERMKSFIDCQELVSRFNEDEAVWRRYQKKCALRLLRGSSSPFPEEVLDRLDWLEAERECRERPSIGRLIV
jgi:hypothetical protein